MKRFLWRIIELFKRLFGINDIVYFDLLDEYEDYVRGQDVSVRDTLVGTVRSTQQYDINIKHKFYHIPETFCDDPARVKYVAIYRSKVIFGSKQPGIKHYGRVSSYEYIKRKDIKELLLSFSADSYYYKFNVDEWVEMIDVIKAREKAPYVSCMTNSYLLKNSGYIYELFFEDNNRFKLHLGIRDIVCGVYDGFFVGEYKVRIQRSKIVIKSQNKKVKFLISDYKHSPYITIEKIADIVYGTDKALT